MCFYASVFFLSPIRAIQASLATSWERDVGLPNGPSPPHLTSSSPSPDADLQAALLLSEEERRREEYERIREEAELAEILRLSLVDK